MKYAIFTYIFGRNTEKIREPKYIDDNVEYICVTDQKGLTSDSWKIIYEQLDSIKSNRDKTAIVKFNPFKYTDADRIIIQDSTLEQNSSVMSLFEKLDKCDICLKKHPCRNNLAEELLEWYVRGITNTQISKFYSMGNAKNIKLSEVPLYECCLMCIKNNEESREIFSALLSLMKLLGENGNMIVTQQCTFAYLLKAFYNDLNINLIKQQDYFTRYEHNSNRISTFG